MLLLTTGKERISGGASKFERYSDYRRCMFMSLNRRKPDVRKFYSEGEEIFEGGVVSAGVVVGVDYQRDIKQIDLTYYYGNEEILED